MLYSTNIYRVFQTKSFFFHHDIKYNFKILVWIEDIYCEQFEIQFFFLIGSFFQHWFYLKPATVQLILCPSIHAMYEMKLNTRLGLETPLQQQERSNLRISNLDLMYSKSS